MSCVLTVTCCISPAEKFGLVSLKLPHSMERYVMVKKQHTVVFQSVSTDPKCIAFGQGVRTHTLTHTLTHSLTHTVFVRCTMLSNDNVNKCGGQ